MQRIRITAGDVSADAVLNDTHTARAIWAALPFRGTVSTWGDEVYFPIPVEVPSQNPAPEVAAGELGYWPPGSAFCIFFGPTPASRGSEIRPASPVNVFGRLTVEPTMFRGVVPGEPVLVEAATERPPHDGGPQNGASK